MSESRGPHVSDDPSPWIARFAPLVAEGARVLDLACGYGRHARFFARRGCQVLAVDRDAAAIATLAGTDAIEAVVADLETGGWPFPGRRFDAIVVARYLHRPLFPHLFAALADDGAFLYDTFARGHQAYGRPTNPDFLLERGELLRLVAGRLAVVAYEDGRATECGHPAVVQRIAAVGLARTWPVAASDGAG
jgi:SAM-dependent methyltransferase